MVYSNIIQFISENNEIFVNVPWRFFSCHFKDCATNTLVLKKTLLLNKENKALAMKESVDQIINE